VNGVVFLAVLYTVKYFIGGLSARWTRVYLFVLLLAASLTCIWLLVVLDWRNPHVFPIACWVYYPFGILLVPTISFHADTAAMSSPSLRWYVARSCVEVVLMVPWLFFWTVLSFFFLHGGWI
jgi:hypothetical protein